MPFLRVMWYSSTSQRDSYRHQQVSPLFLRTYDPIAVGFNQMAKHFEVVATEITKVDVLCVVRSRFDLVGKALASLIKPIGRNVLGGSMKPLVGARFVLRVEFE